MPDYQLDYVELPSSDNARTRDFLLAAFGWTFVNFGPDYDEVHGAGLLGGINADFNDRSAASLPLIRTDDLEEAERAVVAAGGTISRPAYDYPGGRRFFFREPGGAELGMYRPA